MCLLYNSFCTFTGAKLIAVKLIWYLSLIISPLLEFYYHKLNSNWMLIVNFIQMNNTNTTKRK